jgi:hypothetical protein
MMVFVVIFAFLGKISLVVYSAASLVETIDENRNEVMYLYLFRHE